MKTLTLNVYLNNPAKVQITIDGNQLSMVPEYPEISTYFTANYDWPGSPIALELSITGGTGTSAKLEVTESSSVQGYTRYIEILDDGTKRRMYRIAESDFNEIHLPDFMPEESYEDPYMSISEEASHTMKDIVRTQKDVNVEIEVFFATDRESEKTEDYFSGRRSELQYGRCLVNIPKNKALGEIPRPKWWKLEFSENKDKHVMITGLDVFDAEKFFSALNSNGDEKDAFVFIHGYNTGFKEAVHRTAQITFDLGFKGTPITYSWPSAAKTINYLYDEESVIYTKSHMVSFFKDLQAKSKLNKIHIIAHSMGNRVLTNALMALQTEGFFNETKFDQIIMAAPDIDAQVFLKELVPYLAGSSERMTLYASSKDKALQVSRGIHGSIIRLGESGDLITCCEGIDTVDASSTDPSFVGHGYFASTAPLINDMFQLLNFNTAPANRNLLKRDSYWLFR
jgi:esterase/lipase superfamily enzyme